MHTRTGAAPLFVFVRVCGCLPAFLRSNAYWIVIFCRHGQWLNVRRLSTTTLDLFVTPVYSACIVRTKESVSAVLRVLPLVPSFPTSCQLRRQ